MMTRRREREREGGAMPHDEDGIEMNNNERRSVLKGFAE